jgi:hypothetical protein
MHFLASPILQCFVTVKESTKKEGYMLVGARKPLESAVPVHPVGGSLRPGLLCCFLFFSRRLVVEGQRKCQGKCPAQKAKAYIENKISLF